MSETPTEPRRKAEFTLVKRPARFELVGRGTAVRMQLLGSRRAPTLEGKLEGTWLARPLPVAALYLGLVALAETLTVLDYFVPAAAGRFPYIPIAIGLHAFTMFALVTHASFIRRLSPSAARLLVAFAPAPLIRIASLTSPLRAFTYIQWFAIIAIIVYAGIVTSIKLLHSDLPSLGLRLPQAKHLPFTFGIVLLGFGLGWAEYQILRPNPLVVDLSVRELLVPVLILYVATGFLEELAFRGLIQNYACAALGEATGIAFVTITFAALHMGWIKATPWAWLDIPFVASVGMIYSLVRRKTGSILGVSISHGVTNAMLFLVMPFLAR